jgi:hypothetical protein
MVIAANLDYMYLPNAAFSFTGVSRCMTLGVLDRG